MTWTRVNLMVTCVGGTLAGALLENIRDSDHFDYRLIGADAEQDAPSAKKFLDQFYQIPMGNDSDYVERVLAIVKKENVNVVLPGSDDEAAAVAANLGRFTEVGVFPLVSSPETLELIADKADVYARLELNGIPVPEYSVCETSEEILAALLDYGFPENSVIVKPTRGRGGRGLCVFCGRDTPPPWLGQGAREKRMEDERRIHEYIATMKKGRFLVMPCLALPAYDVDVLAENGEMRGLVVRERVNPTGIPFEGNVIRAGEEIIDYCRDVASVLNLDSLHDLDMMSEDGVPRLLEVNPRPSGSMAASLAAGFPLVDVAVSRYCGRPLALPTVQNDIEIMPGADGLTVQSLEMETGS